MAQDINIKNENALETNPYLLTFKECESIINVDLKIVLFEQGILNEEELNKIQYVHRPLKPG